MPVKTPPTKPGKAATIFVIPINLPVCFGPISAWFTIKPPALKPPKTFPKHMIAIIPATLSSSGTMHRQIPLPPKAIELQSFLTVKRSIPLLVK